MLHTKLPDPQPPPRVSGNSLAYLAVDLIDPVITRSVQPEPPRWRHCESIKGWERSDIPTITTQVPNSESVYGFARISHATRPHLSATKSMASAWLALAVAVAVMAVRVANPVDAGDPDPLQDFCVADESNKIFINGFPCKDPAKVVSEDFTYRGLRNQGNLTTSFGAPLQKAFVAQIPGINTQGISWARLDFAFPAGLNVPHWHQRATEILSCQEGELLVGFVDTNNKLWSTVLKKGDITVFPRGLMHFQLNVGKTPAYAVLALNSQNAGRSDVGASTFGAGVKEQILEKAFGLSHEAVKSLEKFFSVPHLQESPGVAVQ